MSVQTPACRTYISMVSPPNETTRTVMTPKTRPPKPNRRTRAKDPNRYPEGWNRRRVQAVLEHYEKQTDEEAVAEDEAAYRDGAFAMIQVPIDLVPEVQRLIAKRAG